MAQASTKVKEMTASEMDAQTAADKVTTPAKLGIDVRSAAPRCAHRLRGDDA